MTAAILRARLQRAATLIVFRNIADSFVAIRIVTSRISRRIIPARNVKVIVPFGAGGPADVLCSRAGAASWRFP